MSERADLGRWRAPDDRVGRLPAGEREVVSLRACHGRQGQEVAGLFGVSARALRRRWLAAPGKLPDPRADEGPA